MLTQRVTVLGSGAWAVSIAALLAQNQHDIRIWTHRAGIADEINVAKKRALLPDVDLPQSLQATTELAAALAHADAIILCMPSRYLADFITSWQPLCDPRIPVLNLVKGMLSTTHPLLLDYLIAHLGLTQGALLSGPNLAAEIALGKPAAAVVASTCSQTATYFQGMLRSPLFRVYTSADTVGVAYGGILKNIMAIAAGCIDALALGYNTKATLITRALTEMLQFATHFGAEPKTIYGLSGLGDLIATCTSPASRNYQYGYRLALGESLADHGMSQGRVAEGVQSTQVVYQLAQAAQIDMPITAGIYEVLVEKRPVKDVIAQLMNRALKAE